MSKMEAHGWRDWAFILVIVAVTFVIAHYVIRPFFDWCAS